MDQSTGLTPGVSLAKNSAWGCGGIPKQQGSRLVRLRVQAAEGDDEVRPFANQYRTAKSLVSETHGAALCCETLHRVFEGQGAL